MLLWFHFYANYVYICNVIYIYIYIPGDLYICGIGGSDYVRGDRLRAGGDCENADCITADNKRVAAAMKSFSSLSTSLTMNRNPDVIQVYIYIVLYIIYIHIVYNTAKEYF
jgi:hypothetical protein